VELEISLGAGIETGLRTLHTDAPQRAVTEHVLALADQAGYGAALIDAVARGHTGAAVITWPQFAHMVRAAARGLGHGFIQLVKVDPVGHAQWIIRTAREIVTRIRGSGAACYDHAQSVTNLAHSIASV